MRMVAVWLLALTACRIGYDPRDLPVDGAAPDATSTIDAAAAADATPDAPVGDGAVLPGPCPLPDSIVCDDFDEGVASTSAKGDWEWAPGAGRSGTGALRVSSVSDRHAAAVYAWAEPVVSGRLHARAYVRVAAGEPVDRYSVLLQLDNGEETSGFEKVSADIISEERLALAAPFTGAGGATTSTMPRESWVCLEVAVVVDETGSVGGMELLADGDIIGSYGPASTLVPGGFSQLIIGAVLSARESPMEVVFDDLIVARAPIGCD